MATMHISEAEAARDFPTLMARARAGTEIIVESEAGPAVVLSIAPTPQVRLLSESLRLAQLRGSAVTLDGEFGKDLEAVVASYNEATYDPWA